MPVLHTSFPCKCKLLSVFANRLADITAPGRQLLYLRCLAFIQTQLGIGGWMDSVYPLDLPRKVFSNDNNGEMALLLKTFLGESKG